MRRRCGADDGIRIKGIRLGGGRSEGQVTVIGKLKVAKTLEKMSYCDVTEGEKNPPAGTVVSAK